MPATIDEVNRLFDRAMKTTHPVKSVEQQLACWEQLKTLIPSFPIDISDPERVIVPGFADSLYDWLPNLELDLGELAAENPDYVPRYIAYLEDVLTNVVVEDHRPNFQRSYAEALGMAGRLTEAEAILARLLEEEPRNAWTWVTWGDLHLEATPPNPARALEIFQQARALGELDDDVGLLDERLKALDERPKALEKPKDRPQPAVSNKIGRNDPCPCQSGKKYKKCCGA